MGLVLSSGSAVAVECGPNGSGDIVELQSWAIQVAPDRMGMLTASTTWSITPTGKLPIRMIDGQVVLNDALGGYILNVEIPRDLTLEPGATFTWSAEYAGKAFERAAGLSQDEVTGIACIRSVVYGDGSEETF